MIAVNPAMSRFIDVPNQPDSHLDREKLDEALRGGFARVRLHLDPSGETKEEENVQQA